MVFDNIFSFADKRAESSEGIDKTLKDKIPGDKDDSKIVREVLPEARAVMNFITGLSGAIKQDAGTQKEYANDPKSTARAASATMKESRKSLESDPDLKPYAAGEKRGRRFPTLNLAYGKVASASTAFKGYPASNAIDGKSDTYWCPAQNNGPSWWKVDLGTPQRIGLIVLETQAYEGNLKNFQVLASEDDKEYVLLEEQGDIKLPSKQPFRLQVDESRRYRYVKIAKTKKESDNYDLTLTQVHIEPPAEWLEKQS